MLELAHLVVAGADHGLPATQDPARFDWLVKQSTDFIAAYGVGDAAANALLRRDYRKGYEYPKA